MPEHCSWGSFITEGLKRNVAQKQKMIGLMDEWIDGLLGKPGFCREKHQKHVTEWTEWLR